MENELARQTEISAYLTEISAKRADIFSSENFSTVSRAGPTNRAHMNSP